MKVLVTGATGTVGAHVVRALRERGIETRAFARDRDPLDEALRGVDRLFLACANVPAQVEYECAVIDAAAAAGIERVVKLSGPAPAIDSPLVFDHWHGQIEAHLERSGLAHVLLRPSAYMTNLLAHAETVKGMHTLFAPAGAAQISYIDPRDVGEAAAAALTGDGHDGRAYTLTGPEAITFEQIAQDLSLVLGRRIAFVDVTDETARQGMIDAGLDPFVADAVVALFRAQRAGMMARTTAAVYTLTGRLPRAFSHFAHDHAALFGAGALAA